MSGAGDEGGACVSGAGDEGGACVAGRSVAGCSGVAGPVAVADGALFWVDKEDNCRGTLKG